MGRIFGTDGVRGVAGSELTAELALNIGRAAAMVLAKEKKHKPLVLVGRDTRISGTMLESAVSAGLCSVGADCCILGVVPTPAVSFLTEHLHADAGVMISASHNTFEFNGIKLFGGDGFKLTDEMEAEIEKIVLDTSNYHVKTGSEIGRVFYNSEAVDEYVAYIAKYYSGNFKGRILVDTANGSAAATAQKLFEN
ncbi:MAG: phosphoglucosamine mutase, partial [Oscillospiraceae bacterium]